MLDYDGENFEDVFGISFEVALNFLHYLILLL